MTGNALVRSSRAVATLVEPVIDAVRRRQWRRFSLGTAATLLVAALSLGFRTRWGHHFIETYAITRPADGWLTVMVKLPLSMFAPAALLPFWFAMVQVFVVYGLAQAALGWRRTLLVAAAGHVAATLSAHLWILAGRPLGVGHRYDHFGDAGPSVAVVALIACVAVARRATWLAVVLVGYHAAEIAVFNGLSQREHLIGAAVGAGSAACVRLAPWWRASRVTVPSTLADLGDSGVDSGVDVDAGVARAGA
jgi:hypothetical protein